MTHEQMIEAAAKAAVRQAGADPLILPALIERLEVWHDGAGKHGPKDGYVVRGRGRGDLSPDAVLVAMRSEPEFASRFGEQAAAFYRAPSRAGAASDPFEAETRRIINERILAVAPDGDPLRVSPSLKVQIDREVRAERGAGPQNARTQAHHNPWPAPTEPIADYKPGDALRRLEEAREAQDAEIRRENAELAALHGEPSINHYRRQAVAKAEAEIQPPRPKPESWVDKAIAERERRGY